MSAGRTVADGLAGHEARRALGRLGVALAHAWDAGDEATWAGGLLPGADDARARWATRAAEPWSLHWLTNGDVRPGPDGDAEARWLWLAASLVDGGARAAWSAGDVAVRARRTPAGWRVATLEATTRFRTPYDEGWLVTPLLPLDTPAAPAGTGTVPPAPVAAGWVGVDEPPAAARSDAVRWAALADDAPVRALLAAHLRHRDERRDGAALAAAWTSDGTYRTVGPDGAARHRGPAEVAAALDAEAALVTARGRFLADQAVVVTGDRARSWGTDLWVATAGGAARWQAHRHALEAVRVDGTWRIASLTRTTVLDAPHATGWAPAPLARTRP